MKKVLIVTALVLALAVPAMAADLSVSGVARFRGFYQDNPSLLNSASLNAAAEKSRAWYDFRIRPEFKIKVNDNITINTRVAIFANERFGAINSVTATGAPAGVAGARFFGANTETGQKGDSARWERGWAAIKTPYGMFEIGRMTGGTWAFDIFDTAAARDRIKHTLPLGNFTLIGIIEKNAEIDSIVTKDEDRDNDAYYLAGIYKMENITVGLLYGYNRVAYGATGLLTASGAGGIVSQVADHLWLPYISAKFGNFTLKSEGHIRNGSQEIDGVIADRSRNGVAFWAEGAYAFGPVTPLLGYAYASGDANVADTDDEQGARWGTEYTPLVVLTDVDALIEGAGVQNAALTGRGYQVVYGGLDYALTESITLRGLVARAMVDEQQGAVDDEIGTEFDLQATWKVMPNLSYQVLFGWLNTGDLYKTVLANQNIDDTWTLYHKLQIDF